MTMLLIWFVAALGLACFATGLIYCLKSPGDALPPGWWLLPGIGIVACLTLALLL